MPFKVKLVSVLLILFASPQAAARPLWWARQRARSAAAAPRAHQQRMRKRCRPPKQKALRRILRAREPETSARRGCGAQSTRLVTGPPQLAHRIRRSEQGTPPRPPSYRRTSERPSAWPRAARGPSRPRFPHRARALRFGPARSGRAPPARGDDAYPGSTGASAHASRRHPVPGRHRSAPAVYIHSIPARLALTWHTHDNHCQRSQSKVCVHERPDKAEHFARSPTRLAYTSQGIIQLASVGFTSRAGVLSSSSGHQTTWLVVALVEAAVLRLENGCERVGARPTSWGLAG